jgi:2-amino-4-hydroxy-6-hydroxymethyldihydropteridine diphosphokinase
MRVGIGLGSNVGDRLANLRLAREATLALPGIDGSQPCLSAPIFETEPVGCPPGSAAFLNTVIEVESELPLPELLGLLRGIEANLGRPSRRPRNSPRSIDLDLLYADDLLFNSPDLILPHPRLTERRFVLAPLAAIRPDLLLPGQQRTVAELLFALKDDPAQVAQVAAAW